MQRTNRGRTLGALLAITAVLFSGCIQEDASPTGRSEKGTPAEAAPLPESAQIKQEILVSSGAASYLNGYEPCEDATETCVRHPFEVTATQVASGLVRIEAQLSWGVRVNDLDLYLFRGGEKVASSTEPSPGTMEYFSTPLGEGRYELVVAPFVTVADTLTLDASFSYQEP